MTFATHLCFSFAHYNVDNLVLQMWFSCIIFVAKHFISMAQMGRKPVKDKKQRLEIWLRKSVINNEGGKEKLKRKIMQEYEAKYVAV